MVAIASLFSGMTVFDKEQRVIQHVALTNQSASSNTRANVFLPVSLPNSLILLSKFVSFWTMIFKSLFHLA